MAEAGAAAAAATTTDAATEAGDGAAAATRWTDDTADSMLAEAFQELQAQPEPDPLSRVELMEFGNGSSVALEAAARAPTTSALDELPNTLFDELDTNNDGVLSRKEFAARKKMEAEHLAQSQRSVLDGTPRRKPYVGHMRVHIACQTEAAEVGDLQQLRTTVGETTTQLEGLQAQIAAAATSASQQFAKRVEEKVAVVQQTASDRLVYVEGKYEDALARARHSANTERTHELAKLRAEQDQALLNLRAEYADRHTNELAKLLRERDEYKDKYEEADHGMRLLRKDLGQLQAVMARKTISKDEHDTVKAEAKKYKELAERYRQAEQKAIREARAAQATAQRDLDKAKQIEKAAKEATRKAVQATSDAQKEVEDAKRMATERVDAIGMELRVVKRLQENTARELENERALRTIISSRQAEAIKKVVEQNTKLKEQMATVLKNTRPSKGAWQTSETGEVQWAEEKPAGQGVHSGVDTLGFSTQWKAYGQAGSRLGAALDTEHPLTTGFRPIPPPASRAMGVAAGAGAGAAVTPRAGGAVTERMRRAPTSGRRSGQQRHTARAMTAT